MNKINMDWKVELVGDPYLLKSLCSELITSEGFSIFAEGEHFFLTVKEFENLTSADEVRLLATEIIKMINGITFHLYNKKGTIISNSISKPNSIGGNDLFVFPEPVFLCLSDNQPSIIITNEDGSSIKSSPQSTLQNLLTATKNNPTKAKIFRLFASGNLDWVSLYRLYEVVYSEIGNQIFSWVNKNSIQNFKHTCNSVRAIGDDARHGFEIKKPPKHPMTLIKAQEMIKLIIGKYLEMV